jgi:class 3 adenylate cyclase
MSEEEGFTGNREKRLDFFKRISVRITILLLCILSIGIGITIYYYLNSQNSTILESREAAIKDQVNVLYLAIKNNMLAGEAPIAVELFKEIGRVDEISEIKLYRKNGVIAFSDNRTLKTVNKNLGKEKFTPKDSFIPREVIEDEHFTESVKKVDDIFVNDIKSKNKRLIVYKPLINQPKCSGCHGQDHVIRGIIKISSPLNMVYEKTRENLILSVIIYGIVVMILSVAIIFFLRRIVIRRIFKIRERVYGVGEGDFKTKIEVTYPDEIGSLGDQINIMIDGLYERFKLTKFVSKSTIDHVKGAEEIELGGEKRNMTVLFTDIRGFTTYSEKRDPHEVIMMLNNVMNAQSEVIDRHGGDIDKFVGDEIMAVFSGDDMVMRAIHAAEEIIVRMKKDFTEPGNAIAVGIGINTGDMISGNMGSGFRMDRTVIGDSVNLGSRLCSIAGKNTIVLSQFSYEFVKEKIDVHEHDSIKVKGKTEPVKIYTLRRIL